jgi:hypothetical protein
MPDASTLFLTGTQAEQTCFPRVQKGLMKKLAAVAAASCVPSGSREAEEKGAKD